MIWILSFACIIIALYGYIKSRFLLNPITSMFGLWGILLPCSGMGFYSTNIPGEEFYLVVLIGLLGYLLGTILGRKKIVVGINIDPKANIRDPKKYKINYTILYILGTIAIIYYFAQLMVVFRLLLSGYDYSYIRELVVSGENNVLNSSALFTVLYNFIASPVTYLLIALLPVELFFGKKKKIFIIMSLGVMFLFVLTTGGRSVILWILLYFVCVFMFYQRSTNKYDFRQIRKYKRWIIAGSIILFIFLLVMTKSRKGKDVDLLQQIFVYFVAPLPHADHYFEVVKDTNVFGYGVSSFYGLLYPFFFLLRLIGVFQEYPKFITDIHYMSFEMMETGYYIGGGLYMNAFVTAFYQPYLDGRYMGVFLVMMLFGFICNQFFVRSYYELDMKAILIYILLLQKILFSFVRFYFTQQAQALCFILAFLVVTSSVRLKRHALIYKKRGRINRWFQ